MPDCSRMRLKFQTCMGGGGGGGITIVCVLKYRAVIKYY